MTLLLPIVFILYPLGSLPLVLVEIYNKRKYAFVLLAIFMGLWSIFYYPFGDQYRYFNDYESYKYISLEDFFNWEDPLITVRLNLVSLLLYCLAALNINFEICRFILVSWGYLLMFSMLFMIDKFKNGKCPYVFVLSIMMFFLVPYFWICFGFRTGMGAIFFSYGAFLVNEKGNKWGFFYGILAILIHFMYILPLLLFLLPRNFFFSRKNIGVVLFLIFLFNSCFLSLMNFLGDNVKLLNNLVDDYINGEYGLEYNWYWFTYLLFLCNCSPLLFMLYCFFKNYQFSYYATYLVYCVILIFLFLPFQAPLERYIVCSTLLFGVYHIIHFYSKFHTMILICLLSILFIQPFVLYAPAYRRSDQELILYSSAFSLLKHHYKWEDVNKHVFNDGTYRD